MIAWILDPLRGQSVTLTPGQKEDPESTFTFAARIAIPSPSHGFLLPPATLQLS